MSDSDAEADLRPPKEAAKTVQGLHQLIQEQAIWDLQDRARMLERIYALEAQLKVLQEDLPEWANQLQQRLHEVEAQQRSSLTILSRIQSSLSRCFSSVAREVLTGSGDSDNLAS